MIVTVTFNPSFDKTLEIPDFAAGNTLKARTIRRQPAGKGVNVSRCLSTLDIETIATGFLGDAEIDAFTRSFAGTTTKVDFVPVDGATRQNTTILDPTQQTETHIREEGFTIQPDDLTALHMKIAEIVKQGDLAVFSGSLPPGMEPNHLAEFIKQCKMLGAYVAVDTSGPALTAAVEADCSIIKPNLDELREVAAELIKQPAADKQGVEEELFEAARHLLCHVRVLLVTLGGEGAYCFSSGGCWKAWSKVKNVKNTVGAGDAFLAGFAASYVAGDSLDQCLRQAVGFGGASTLMDWAGEVDSAVVRKIAKKAKVKEINPQFSDSR